MLITTKTGEAIAMNAKIIIVHKHRKLPELIDVSIHEIQEEPIKYVWDTREMKYETHHRFIENICLVLKKFVNKILFRVA